jgi:hypothetical protein
MFSRYADLESALIDALVEMRTFLSKLDEPPNSMEFEIVAEGRVLDGDLKIEFKLSDCGYPSTYTKGGNLDNVVKEFARRYGWKQKNDPLYLPKVSGNDEVLDEQS